VFSVRAHSILYGAHLFHRLNGEAFVLAEETKKPDISVIIPAYNEGETIGEVLRRLAKIDWPLHNMEVVVVDDGSTDQTQKEIESFPFVKYIRHKKNGGKGAAIRTGVKSSTGKVIVIQDADMEYPPECIPHLVKPILTGVVDIVYGSRFRGKYEQMSLSHFIGNKILSLVTRILYNAPITDVMTGHKAFDRAVFNSFELNEDGFSVEVEMTSKGLQNGWRFMEVPIRYSPRNFGVSKIVYLDGIKSLLRLIIYRCKGSARAHISDYCRDNNNKGRN